MSAVTSSSPSETNNHNWLPDLNQNEMPEAQVGRSSLSKHTSTTTTTPGRSTENRTSTEQGCSAPLKRPNRDGESKETPSSSTPTLTPVGGEKPPPTKRNWREQPNVGKYKLIRTLGKGNFAKVKLAQHITTKKEVAVKVIDKGQLNKASLNKLFREVSVMKQLNHPNIVKLYEVIESERHVYLVMEFASNGELFEYLVSNGRMKEKEARIKFRQIVSAVQYCHSHNIVHRDLKAENLLLDADYNIKLADFGFSNHYSTNKMLDTFCGSPPYAAPELFKGQKYVGPEVDVWSLGVILYTIVSGYLPFDATNLRDLRERVLRGKYRIPFFMSTDCEVLLKRMLVLAPEKRHSLLAVMEDKWTNIGMEDDILRPYVEPLFDYNDPVRLALMTEMGFTLEDIKDSLQNKRFNNVTATYLLLGDGASAVNTSNRCIASLPDSSSVIQTDDMEAPNTPQVLVKQTSSSAHSNPDTKSPNSQTWLKRTANSSNTSSAKEAKLEGEKSSALTFAPTEKEHRTNLGGRVGGPATSDSKPLHQSVREGDKMGVKCPNFAPTTPAGEKIKSSGDHPAKEPLQGLVRRINTFSAPSNDVDKRRNTLAVTRACHKAEYVNEVTNPALVRVHHVDNIVDQLSGGEEEESNGLISPKHSTKTTDEADVTEVLITPNHATTLPDSTKKPSSDLKRRDSFWKRMRRSMTKKNKRPTVPSIHFNAVDAMTDKRAEVPNFMRGDLARQTSPPRTYDQPKTAPPKEQPQIKKSASSDSVNTETDGVHPRSQEPRGVDVTMPRCRPTSKAGNDSSQSHPPNANEAAALLKHSKRYRNQVQLDEPPKEPDSDLFEAPVAGDALKPPEETPTEVHAYSTIYSNTSFFRSITSRISRSFRRKRSQKPSTGPASAVASGAKNSPLQGRLTSTPNTASGRTGGGTSKGPASSETADPWSPMLSNKLTASGSNGEGELSAERKDHLVDLSGSQSSLGSLLPSCWGRKPRKIPFPRKSRLTGSDPDRLISELIAALTISRLRFVRLGEYKLQFVFSKGSLSTAPTANPFDVSTPLTKIIQERSGSDFEAVMELLFQIKLRAVIEVCQFLATNTYAVRFTRLSGKAETYKLVADSIAKLIKSSAA